MKTLDHDGAEEMPHGEIATIVSETYKVPDWWTQMVTVGYERIKGLRARGQRRDGSYEANKSRTYNVPVSTLFEAWADANVRRTWLDGASVKVRTATAPKSMRLGWTDGSIIAVGFMAKGKAKSAVALAHTKLPDRATADRLKAVLGGAARRARRGVERPDVATVDRRRASTCARRRSSGSSHSGHPGDPMCASLVRVAAGLVVVRLVAGGDAGAQPAIPTREVREEIRIASNDAVPGMALTTISDLAVMPDGRMVTAHGREAVVRIFAPDGRLLRTIGRRGDGPGEFRNPYVVGYIGDTIWVHDSRRRRYIRIAANYETTDLVASPPRTPTLGLTSGTTSLSYAEEPTPLAIFRGDSIVRGFPIPIRTVVGHSFEVRDDAMRGAARGRGPVRTMYSPLATGTFAKLVPGGRELVLVESAELWGGRTGQLAVRRVQTATGDTSRTVVVTLPARAVTRSEGDSLIAERAGRSGRLANQIRANARVPSHYPAVGDVRVGADGAVWVADAADMRSWVVVDRAGTPLARVRLPARFTVFAVSRTQVWGALLDDVDLPTIVRYAIAG